VVSSLLAFEFLVVLLFMTESHSTSHNRGPVPSQEGWNLFRRTQRTNSSGHEDENDDESGALLETQTPVIDRINTHSFNFLSVDLVIIIGTSAISHFCGSAYNKLLIDFLSSPFPAGRDLSAKETGYVWSGTALVCIIVQALAFTKVAKQCGYARFYSITLAVLTLSWLYTPFIGLNAGTAGLWIQLILGLILRKIADISNFTCWLLLVCLLKLLQVDGSFEKALPVMIFWGNCTV